MSDVRVTRLCHVSRSRRRLSVDNRIIHNITCAMPPVTLQSSLHTLFRAQVSIYSLRVIQHSRIGHFGYILGRGAQNVGAPKLRIAITALSRVEQLDTTQ